MTYFSFDLITYTISNLTNKEPYIFYNEKYIDSETFQKKCIAKVYPAYIEYDSTKIYINVTDSDDKKIYATIYVCVDKEVKKNKEAQILGVVTKVFRNLKLNYILD
jgi:hypothetical protein